MTTETVRVPLGDRAYDIHIGAGLLETVGTILSPLLSRKRVVVVTDENVYAAQGQALKNGLSGIDAEFIILKPGEATKSFEVFQDLTGQLLNLGVERDDIVIAFGGGVIGDLTGFVCAILRRGCRFAQIPTSLLAQVDSAVGGKTAINAPQGKNLIGAFHQPTVVIADTTSLETLSPRELRAGYAEIVKYGLISDAAFFDWLEKNGPALLTGDQVARIYAVKKSCEAKAAIVGADEHERGKRALLNLGHTFGHAFEAVFGFSDKLLHGEGVALGMVLAFEYSARRGMCSADQASRVNAHLAACNLPVEASALSNDLRAATLIEYMKQDKKVEQGALTLILANAIGDGKIVKDADIEDVADFLKEKTGQ